MLISEEEKNRILNLHKEQWEKIDLNEEPEKDTYWVISSSKRHFIKK